jgi:RsiW-degrading membrane proteinase PrsW (M82 family)
MAERDRFDWRSAGQFLFSSLTVFFSLLISSLGFLMVFAGDLLAEVPIPRDQVTSSYLFLAGIGFVGLLLIPSAFTSGKSLLGKEQRSIDFSVKSWWLVLAVPPLIAAGYFLSTASPLGLALFILVHLLANAAVVLWMLQLLRRKLPHGSAQRFWGMFGSGLALAPLLALVLEFALLLLIILIWLVYLQTQPELLAEINALLNRLPQSAVSPSILERIAGKYLIRPGVLGTIFVYVAVLIPVIEELIKPVGVWLLLDRDLSPWEGFLLGGLGGAGYALFENLTIGANTEVWTGVIISRMGTTAVHILTSGLVGWGLASAWSKSRYLRLGSAYFSAVVLHGVWNGLNIINLLTSFPDLQDQLGTFVGLFAAYAPAGLLILSLGSFGGILRFNAVFRKKLKIEAGSSQSAGP